MKSAPSMGGFDQRGRFSQRLKRNGKAEFLAGQMKGCFGLPVSKKTWERVCGMVHFRQSCGRRGWTPGQYCTRVASFRHKGLTELRYFLSQELEQKRPSHARHSRLLPRLQGPSTSRQSNTKVRTARIRK